MKASRLNDMVIYGTISLRGYSHRIDYDSLITDGREGSEMDQVFLEDMAKVIDALRDAEFAPYDQLVGYVLTGNPLYITSRGNARAIVTGMDREMIRDYLTRNGKWPEVYA